MQSDSQSATIVDFAPVDLELRAADRNQLFLDPSWWGVLDDVYGLTVRIRAALDGAGNMTGALPWVRVEDPGGVRTVSLPFCDFVDAPMTTAAWQAISDSLEVTSMSTTSAHPASDDDRFASAVDGAHHLVDVRPDADELLAGFAGLTRRKIRQAARSGITYRFAADLASLEEYHQLHVRVRKYRHGLLAQSPEFFRSVGEHFFPQGNGGVMLAELDGGVIGACVLLHTANAVHYKFAASNPDHLRLGVSHGLVFASLQHTKDLGLSTFDLGRSDSDHQGLLDFKRRFRPSEHLLCSHKRVASEETGSGAARVRQAEFRRQLRDLTDFYIRPDIPDSVTAAAGAQLYRYFA